MVAVLAIVTGAGKAVATATAAAVATVIAADCAVVIGVGVVAELALASLPAKCTLFLDGALGLRIDPRVLGWFVALVGAFVVAVVAILVEGLLATLPATL